jgi:hypothetical protein
MSGVTYKIRKANGLFSHGVINHSHYSPAGDNVYGIKWSSKGKEWSSEKTVKDHLLKCAQKGILEDTWEVIQVVHQPTKPISEWIDDKMLIKLIKGGNK